MREKLIVFGCGGHARSVLDVIFSLWPKVSVILVDPGARVDEAVMGCPVFSRLEQVEDPFFFALGSSMARKDLWERYGDKGLASILSPKAHIGERSIVADGVFIGHGAHIGPEASIGLCTIVNTGAIVEHEAIVGEFSHVAPGSIVAGRCRVGSRTFIGSGSVVRDNVEIGSDIIIGAGSVVVSDLLDPGVYIGCPAKKMSSVKRTPKSTEALY